MSVMDSPSALAFSRSMSSLNCGASSTPLGRTPASRGFLRGLAQQLVARGEEGLVRQPAAILQHQVEAGGVAELEHRRRRHRDDVGFLDARRNTCWRAPNKRLHGLRLLLALVPVPQLDEQQAGVLAGAREVEAGHGEHALDRCPSPRSSGTAAPCRARPRCAPSRRRAASAPGRSMKPVIFVRQERGRNAHEQQARHDAPCARNTSIERPGRASMPLRPRSCCARPLVEHAVEPAEEALVLHVPRRRQRLEDAWRTAPA